MYARQVNGPARRHGGPRFNWRVLHFVLLSLSVLAAGAARTLAAPPDLDTIIKRMKATSEPARPSTRRIVIAVRSEGETVE